MNAMFKVPPSYRVPLGISVTLHVLLFLAIMIELPKNDTYRMNRTTHRKVKVINAVAIDQQKVDKQIKALKKREEQKKAEEIARVKRLQEQALVAKQKRIREQSRLAKIKEEQLRLKKQRIARAKALALKKQREKIAKQQAAKKQALALAAKQKQLQQRMMQQQLQQEQKQLATARAAEMQGVLDQYKAKIIQAIQQQWIVPTSASKTLSCVLLVRLAPGGVVLNVQTVTSSGNAALDRSARVAVFKASPLPVPKDPAVFNQFRELRLTVRPENVTNS